MLTTLQYVEDMAEKDLTIEKLLKKNREICLSEKFFEYKYEEALNGKNFLEKEVEMLEKLLQQKNEKERENNDLKFQIVRQELQRLKDTTVEKAAEVKELKQKLTDTLLENKVLHENVDKMNRKCKGFEEMLKENEEMKENLQTTASKYDDNVLHQERKIKKLLAENKELTAYALENQLYKDEANRLKQEVKDIIEKLDETTLLLVKEREAHQQREFNITGKLSTQIKHILEHKDSEIKEITTANGKLNEDLEKCNLRLTEKIEMVKFLYSKVKEVEIIAQQRTFYQKNYGKMKESIGVLRKKIAKMKLENQKLTEKLNTKTNTTVDNKAFKNLAEKFKVESRKREELEIELQRFIIKDSTERVRTTKSPVHVRQDEKQLAQLKASEQTRLKEEDIAKLKYSIQLKNTEIEKLKKDLDTAEQVPKKEMNKTKNKMTEIQEELRVKTIANDRMKHQISELEKKVNCVKEEYEVTCKQQQQQQQQQQLLPMESKTKEGQKRLV